MTIFYCCDWDYYFHDIWIWIQVNIGFKAVAPINEKIVRIAKKKSLQDLNAKFENNFGTEMGDKLVNEESNFKIGKRLSFSTWPIGIKFDGFFVNFLDKIVYIIEKYS